MAPLIVLVISFVGALSFMRLRTGTWSPGPAGRVGASVMFVFTGVSHFVFPEPMAEMVPPLFPLPIGWVYAAGGAEILGGVGLLVPRTRRIAAWSLAIFLVAVFPANIYAAIHRVGMGGHVHGPGYLWLRAPLQLLFLGWVVYFGLMLNRPKA